MYNFSRIVTNQKKNSSDPCRFGNPSTVSPLSTTPPGAAFLAWLGRMRVWKTACRAHRPTGVNKIHALSLFLSHTHKRLDRGKIHALSLSLSLTHCWFNTDPRFPTGFWIPVLAVAKRKMITVQPAAACCLPKFSLSQKKKRKERGKRKQQPRFCCSLPLKRKTEWRKKRGNSS